jgi:hypothetical protein
MEVVLGVGSALYLLQVLAQIRVSVREAVTEVNGVISGVESVRKSQRIIFLVRETITVDLIANVVLVVADLSAYAMPAKLVLFSQVVAVGEHAHSLIVKTVRLGQVYNIEPDFVAFPRVRHFEEKPLSMAISVDVVLQH